MGVDLNWSLLANTPSIGDKFQQGVQMGRQQAIQTRSDNALAAVQKNPDDANALGTLALYNPAAANSAIQMRQLQRQQLQRQVIASAIDPATGQIDWNKATVAAAQKDPTLVPEIRQQQQAHQQAQLQFAQHVTQAVVQDAGDVTDEASYQRFLARAAPQWKAANLPIPDWLPQHYSEDGIQAVRLHALSTSEQLKQLQPDPLVLHPGDVVSSKTHPNVITAASPVPRIIPGTNGAFYQQDPYQVPAGAGEDGTSPAAPQAMTPASGGHTVPALPQGWSFDAVGGPSPAGSGTFRQTPAQKSYLNPAYAPVETHLEQKYGLPPGIMAAIRTKGERSNDDQVSEAGGRSVYQVIPDTRQRFLNTYGVDAYAGPYQAATVAALHLRDSLRRNGGDVTGAIREYVGGTNPSRWGPRTRAYVTRTAGGF